MILRNRKGQTGVEYIFLVAVIATIIFSLAGRLREYFNRGLDNCDENSTHFVCVIFSNFGEDTEFRTFAVHGINKDM